MVKNRKAFSLIELMIVIVIIGALTAIILPSFDVSESEAKETASGASSYGTLSQLTKFHALYGAYPSRLHTGFEASSNTVGSAELMGATSGVAGLPNILKLNMSSSGQSAHLNLGGTDAVNIKTSLRKAGMYYLSSGGFPTSLSDASRVNVAFVDLDAESSTSGTIYVCYITSNWYDSFKIGTNGLADSSALNESGEPISINGIALPYYSYNDAFSAFSDSSITASSTTITTAAATDEESAKTVYQDGILIPLFITPATDWEYWYDQDGNKNEAQVGVSQVGACPWFEPVSDFRYYIAIFKAYTNGDKAKLIGTLSPKCESINP